MPAAAAAGAGAIVTMLLGGGAGIPFRDLGETDPERSPGIGYLRPRIQFTWEPDPLPYGDVGTTAKRTSVVPELEIGALVGDRGDAHGGWGWDVYAMGGVKLQGDMSVHQVGFLSLSMRSSLFVAARGGLVSGGAFTPLGEAAIGEHLWWGSRRFTFEAAVGVLDRPDDNDAELTAMLSLGCGWAP